MAERFDQSSGQFVCDFVSCLPTTDTGRPFCLYDWQRGALMEFYGTMEEDAGELLRKYWYLFLRKTARVNWRRPRGTAEEAEKRELLHVHNTCFRWTFGNVRCHVDGNGNIKPLKNRSIGRIDPTAASIIVMAVWMIARNQPPDLAEAIDRADYSL